MLAISYGDDGRNMAVAINRRLKHHGNTISPQVKQHGSNARCLLGFLATHDYFSLFF
jgi:hypothetical protein